MLSCIIIFIFELSNIISMDELLFIRSQGNWDFLGNFYDFFPAKCPGFFQSNPRKGIGLMIIVTIGFTMCLDTDVQKLYLIL